MWMKQSHNVLFAVRQNIDTEVLCLASGLDVTITNLPWWEASAVAVIMWHTVGINTKQQIMNPHPKLSAVPYIFYTVCWPSTWRRQFLSEHTPFVTNKPKPVKAAAYSLCSQILRPSAVCRCTKTLGRVILQYLRTMQEISAQISEELHRR